MVLNGKILIKAFNVSDEVVIKMKISGVDSEYLYTLEKEEWYASIDKSFSNENFLQFLPLFDFHLERALSLSHIIDALTKFEEYKLTKSLHKVYLNIISEINKRVNYDKDERIKLYELLMYRQDILFEVCKELYISKNSELLLLVSQILNSINYQDAQQIIKNTVGDKNNIFDVKILTKKIKQDELLFHLAYHSEEMIETWKAFDAKERIDNAFSFINLFVFWQEFDDLPELELSLNELNQLTSADEPLLVETLPQYFFNKDNAWEGTLITPYLISSGIKKQQFIHLFKSLLQWSQGFEFMNTSALAWLYMDKLFKDSRIEYATINELMQELQYLVDDKSIWDDKFIKKIYCVYVNKLLVSGDPLFDDMYKLGLSHYLLDNEFYLEEHLLAETYLRKDQLNWILSVELSRKKAISTLTDSSHSEALLHQLEMIEYFSTDIVKKVKFELYSNILNLESDKVKLTNAAYGLMKVGGDYDGLMAAKKLDNSILHDYYESILIRESIRFKSINSNNYWYHQALILRKSTKSKRLSFLYQLYMHINSQKSTGTEQLHLIRLFFSELLWSVEEGLVLEDLHIEELLIDEMITTLIESNDDAEEYSQLFKHYLKLANIQDKDKLFSLETFIEKNISFETKDRLKDILKTRGNGEIETATAKQYMRQAMLYPYTLIMVYSCQAYIPTRQKAIRETWLQRAQELGIDCVFIVGGNDVSEVKDDMLYLAVEDSYERLPQKSIEMFRFAYEQFAYEYFMKIDDDCFLNVDAYFSDEVLFQTDYYGRYLSRAIGETDRIWHQKKSQSTEAKNAIDLSPEPSCYADGSTGYVLSRKACEQLVEAYTDSKNNHLVSSSFMEDKLVGDLLIGRGIKVDASNFTAVVYRKLTEEIEATFWEYNLFPSMENGMKVLHCETEKMLQLVWKNFIQVGIATHQNQYFSNQKIENFQGIYSEIPCIEEIKIETDKLGAATHVAVIICKNEYVHLPALLKHHRAIGIEHFIYIDNASNDKSVEYMIDQKDVSVLVSTQAYKDFRFSVDWLEAAFTNFCYGKWVLVIDADELFVYDDFENKSIASLTQYADSQGYDSFLAPMVDMYNKGKLSNAILNDNIPYTVCNYFDNKKTMDIQVKETFGPYSNAPVYASGLRARVFGKYNFAPSHSYLNQKYCLFKYKPTHKFIEGLHFMGNHNPAPIRAALLHFKYHAGFYDKVHEQILSGQHWNGSQEYKRYLNKLEQNNDLSLYDEKVSIEYTGSSSLIDTGYMDKVE